MSLKSSLTDVMPSPLYIRLLYLYHFGKLPHLRNPRTFNEKLQWLKLHDHNPIYTTMVDKVRVKEYVTSLAGAKYIIPNLGIWNNAEEIDFDILPDRFVIKCNHDSHGVIVVNDKGKTNLEAVREKLRKRLQVDGYAYGREWPYKDVERKILAEKFIEGDSGELIDYKVHCFGGEPKFILVCQDRFSDSGLKEDFYDIGWELMDVRRPNVGHGTPVKRPDELDEMLELARLLSKGVPFLRTDFYYTQGKILFGELTFFPASGFQRFVPDRYDRLFGDWIELPRK